MTRLQRTISAALEANGHPPLDKLIKKLRPGTSWRGCSAEVTRLSGEPCSNVNLMAWYDDDGKPLKKKTVAS